ncbi:MAG TPA: hypothetical protein DEB40_10000 [Elusimicrobia bacterium]|nr:hypothetical protein [Elusimicrobiota bacterium]HBT62061.1 hypothetical protein [Elusimicrobiota bacterium]
MTFPDGVERIGMAKTAVDRGFSLVGPGLNPADEAAQALMLLACRSVALANAVAVLVKHNHAHEALALLRSLLELAAHARWIAQEQSEARAREFLREHGEARWEKLWPQSRLARRLEDLGMSRELGARIEDWCQGHIWGNAAGLPWAHVFSSARRREVSPQDVLGATADLMAEVVSALERRWPGKFS